MAALPSAEEERVLCTSLGRGQLAAHLAAASPKAKVTCNFFDLYLARQARGVSGDLDRLNITCQADFPDAEYDLATIPLSMSGDGELTRELLQQAHQRLAMGGRLFTATDNPCDTWLHEVLKEMFAKVKRAPQDNGVLYQATKTAPLKKVRDFRCEFAFRDRGRLIKAMTRPGVFSHRRVDPGARALMETMAIQPGQRVLDIGCGWGPLSLAAAACADSIHVYAVDSNPRSVQCTQRNAHLNGLSNITAVLDCNADCDAPGTYDVALANPPYYSHFKIAEIFQNGAVQALKPGGVLYVVTKQPVWHLETMTARFENVISVKQRDYTIVSGAKFRL
jgi:16S rRNA (guanine1207-N2)-methyltransferase